MVESNVELVEDFGGGMSTSSCGLSCHTMVGTRDGSLGLLGYLGYGGGCHCCNGGFLSWKSCQENSGVNQSKTSLKQATCSRYD